MIGNNHMTMRSLYMVFAMALMVCTTSAGWAQSFDDTDETVELIDLTDTEIDTDTQVAAQERESIFFSIEELEMILQVSQGIMTVGDEATAGTTGEAQAEQQPVDRGRRVLTLSGVVYQSPNDWTIWLNGERVTPKNIPENVRGLIVHTDHIRLRWFDRAENRIVNIALRPHQQYNLDLDTILPGTR